MSNESHGSGGGVGLMGLLGVVFIALKLTDNIDWSWWWVLAPFWIPLALVIMYGLVLLVVAARK